MMRVGPVFKIKRERKKREILFNCICKARKHTEQRKRARARKEEKERQTQIKE